MSHKTFNGNDKIKLPDNGGRIGGVPYHGRQIFHQRRRAKAMHVSRMLTHLQRIKLNARNSVQFQELLKCQGTPAVYVILLRSGPCDADGKPSQHFPVRR